MRDGSFNSMLAGMRIADYHYIETSAEQYASVQRTASTHSRFPASMQGCRFTTALYRAVGTAADDVRYLVRVERTA